MNFLSPVWSSRRRGLDRVIGRVSAAGERGQAPAYSESPDVRPLHFCNHAVGKSYFTLSRNLPQILRCQPAPLPLR